MVFMGSTIVCHEQAEDAVTKHERLSSVFSSVGD